MLLCLSSSLFFSYASDICAAIDLSSSSSFWMDSIAIESFVSHQIGDYCLSYKLFYGGNASDEFNYLEFAVDLCAYPIENSGFKVGLSIVKAGLFWGMGAQDLKPILSSETFVSWEIKFSNLYIEPRICFSESILEESEAEKILRETIKQYSKVRLSLFLGFAI